MAELNSNSNIHIYTYLLYFLYFWMTKTINLFSVTCSTPTVTKCQAALRTLQSFPFFKPTCLCKEPRVDPDCNQFKDFLIDHPCLNAKYKETDPYPVDALPTCDHAQEVCGRDKVNKN